MKQEPFEPDISLTLPSWNKYLIIRDTAFCFFVFLMSVPEDVSSPEPFDVLWKQKPNPAALWMFGLWKLPFSCFCQHRDSFTKPHMDFHHRAISLHATFTVLGMLRGRSYAQNIMRFLHELSVRCKLLRVCSRASSSGRLYLSSMLTSAC